MERGGSSSQHIQHTYSRRPKSVDIKEPNPTNNAPTDGSSNVNPQQSYKRDADQYMPIANVTRIMRRILPPHAKIADDAKETIQECVSEFINVITAEANDKCHQEYRKTITPEDVLSAMGSLGFDNYVETLTLYLNKYRAQDPDRGPIQQVQFVRRTPSVVQHPVAQGAHPPPAPSAPVMTMPYVPLPPTYAANDANYLELPQMTDYFKRNQGGGEGSSREMQEFDPFN